MFVRFLRENAFAAFLLTIVRLYLGWLWFQAGFKKVTGDFDASGFLQGAVKKASGDNPAVQPWWSDFLTGVAIPNVGFFNQLVPWGEFLVGIGLLLGTFTTLAVLMGAVMNFAYLFSGAISSNPQMILMEVLLLVAGFNAAKIGLDGWIIPFFRRKFTMKKSVQNPVEA